MAEITENFGAGGQGLVPNQGDGPTPSLATALRDIILDITDIQPDASTITQGALAAFTDPPTAGEMANLRTLVNQLRTAMLANGNVTLRSTAP